MFSPRGQIIIVVFLFLSNIAWAQEDPESHHCLVEKNSFSIGAGPSYSFDLETVGINSRFYYNIREDICFGPEFSYLKTEEAEVFDFDFVVHYIFETPWLGIYPVIGANYTIENNNHNQQEAAFGVMYGAGIHRNIKKFTVFAEFTHIESKLRDNFFTAGILYRMKLK